jgi:hypothetical protein
MAKIQTGQVVDLQVMSQVEAKVGDYKWSHLEVTPFGDEHLGQWMLCDGQSASGTAFATLTGETNVPNALADGTFIRQAKSGRTKGSYEADENKSHNHTHVKYGQTTSTGSYGIPPQGSSSTPQYGTTSTVGDEARPKNIALNLYVKVGY